MNKGIIAVNKPKDWTSFDVVNRVKHLLKKQKIGHLGTLDPMATGVLLITVNKATKLFDLMQEKQKTYIATFQFGYETDSLDATGKLVASNNKQISVDELDKELSNFIGEIDQIPPKYSAKSINGVRAYDLARKGVDFDLKAKKVKIYSIEIISFDNNVLKLKIVCGSGTYIRAIGRDIAHKLGTFATMIELIRTQVGNISVENCENISNLTSENIEKHIYPIKNILPYKEIALNNLDKQKLLNGQVLNIDIPDGKYTINDENDVQAIIKVKNKVAKMDIYLV